MNGLGRLRTCESRALVVQLNRGSYFSRTALEAKLFHLIVVANELI